MKVDDYLEIEKPKLISVFTEGEEEETEEVSKTVWLKNWIKLIIIINI